MYVFVAQLNTYDTNQLEMIAQCCFTVGLGSINDICWDR